MRLRQIPRPALATTIVLCAALGPTGLDAQEEGPDRERESCICVGDVAGRAMAPLAPFGSRARLGVYLGDERVEDGLAGVVVEELADDSPAAEAGLRGGDLIVAVDGAPLGDDPRDALLRHMRDVEPGDTVEVGYLRDGRPGTALVETEAASRVFRFGMAPPGAPRPPMAPGAPRLRFELDEGPGGLIIRRSMDGLRLVDMNPELGRYFETERGALVLDVDADSSLGLEPGDVILAIGGRQVRDADHALAILASYESDEAVTLRVVREGRERDVTGSRGGSAR